MKKNGSRMQSQILTRLLSQKMMANAILTSKRLLWPMKSKKRSVLQRGLLLQSPRV